ncbi:signal recognition particle (docking protein) [Tepidanaerobacter acetatoxydans Re1]|uniref:Signal recognition particle receptor FtsY n=1 Tax=Tepidanaerobacter acetatoxydans (strain DSM 21804 / JCM 16047 / Re1) TaxID=1209989 RepID=F4LTL2_TEPAE|nr:signal recognition particle-docking protein FtsY [Tepidanaerobacter acetatoxydans]AEE91342.1 signal recognition particle-docking protein FtsY [Tepidanaerobacter acetatoxydans Re1]CCP26035.1 signal recognition particle (docking protein) [Tepidanaerobacter acetatoxydans Re1]
MAFIDKLKQSLSKTRESFSEKFDNILKFNKKIDEKTFEELEELLISADVGVSTTQMLIEKLKENSKKITAAEELKSVLKEEIIDLFPKENISLTYPTVMLIVGVNGVGKTTSIGKLANIYKNQGKKVILAAADTFRAAAIDQLEIWGQRVGVDVIKHQEGADPASVLFDALQAGKARKADLIICDTAGRLHTKKNLMEELKKLYRVCQKEYPQANVVSLIVLDATTGQNALIQAKMFKEAVDFSGIILTKLDGTAKGGIVIAIASELGIPVWYIGIGEGINDLHEFNSQDFVDAIFA